MSQHLIGPAAHNLRPHDGGRTPQLITDYRLDLSAEAFVSAIVTRRIARGSVIYPYFPSTQISYFSNGDTTCYPCTDVYQDHSIGSICLGGSSDGALVCNNFANADHTACVNQCPAGQVQAGSTNQCCPTGTSLFPYGPCGEPAALSVDRASMLYVQLATSREKNAEQCSDC